MTLVWWLGRKTQHREGRDYRWFRRGVLLLSLVGVVLVAMVLVSPEKEQGRFLSLLGISGQTRLALWSTAGGMFTEAPFFGHGYGVFSLLVPAYRPDFLAELYPHGNVFFKTAHSECLQQMGEVGIVGLALLFALLVSLLVRLSRRFVKRDSPESGRSAACLIAALTALLVHALFNSSLRFPVLMFDMVLLIVLSSASSIGGRSRQRAGRSRLARWGATAAMGVLLAVVVLIAHDSGSRALSTGFYKAAKHQLHVGESEAADLQLQRSLDMHPENIEARYLLASRHYDKAEYSSAYREYLRVWKEAPHFANVLYDLGVCALQMERPELARSWLARSRSLNPYRQETIKALELVGDEPPTNKSGLELK